MLGIIITGHGEFSQGLLHAGAMIAGKQEHVVNINFKDGMPMEEFQGELLDQINVFQEKYNGVLVLTDLKGGTPFNVSMMIAANTHNVRVLSGTNLPMIIEGTMMSQFSDSVDDLAKQLVITGQTGIEVGELIVKQVEDPLDEEDGI